MMEVNTSQESKPKSYKNCIHQIDKEMAKRLEEMLKTRDFDTQQLAIEIIRHRDFSDITRWNMCRIFYLVKEGDIHTFKKHKWWNDEEGFIEIWGNEAYFKLMFRAKDNE